ncbi:hypothetical protein PtA15_13A261 [Puccinia triticina]|uniref:GST N-terminal domain-containing protein n=1 Tax=Puccinia triticina TaxID=208348 RepID=A0ABY7CZV7_9BASI|nr:uncharacterized protein PtA15_13A261 [Puccinia triticina]WAQ90861.1 hypothetical protein PtA15_13A261 [Puccinia triticina]
MPVYGGVVTKPAASEFTYIPQRPYLSLGTLRDQLIYPDSRADMAARGVSDDNLLRILAIVDLDAIFQREGGWDVVREWRDALSGAATSAVKVAAGLTNSGRNGQAEGKAIGQSQEITGTQDKSAVPGVPGVEQSAKGGPEDQPPAPLKKQKKVSVKAPTQRSTRAVSKRPGEQEKEGDGGGEEDRDGEGKTGMGEFGELWGEGGRELGNRVGTAENPVDAEEPIRKGGKGNGKADLQSMMLEVIGRALAAEEAGQSVQAIMYFKICKGLGGDVGPADVLPVKAYHNEHPKRPRSSQKLNDFIKLNPNAINTQSAPFCVMESGAISQYLCSRIDQNNNFRFADCTQSSEMEQWISWGLSHLGILIEECIHFARYASTRDTYSIEYYQNQILEAFDELEQHLAQRASIVARSYIAGLGSGKYSLADMAIWPWINVRDQQ